ncbi:hypothetical protein K439DRAFT_1126327 [Ramaria rubella]|nr:hypothetical protein K439DRAFT_1126327 [Ramaria rubella]
MELLQLTDSFIIQHCIIQRNSNEFMFKDNTLDGLMLAHGGLEGVRDGCMRVSLCPDCYGPLARGAVPRLALKNRLYRGNLPNEFQDLMWVEEMVCTIYRNTAHVTRIYESSEASQPRVLHGNTCAHEMNVVSTVERLPRSPVDINGMLSIVFIGPEKFDPEKLKNIFYIRKKRRDCWYC